MTCILASTSEAVSVAACEKVYWRRSRNVMKEKNVVSPMSKSKIEQFRRKGGREKELKSSLEIQTATCSTFGCSGLFPFSPFKDAIFLVNRR